MPMGSLGVQRKDLIVSFEECFALYVLMDDNGCLIQNTSEALSPHSSPSCFFSPQNWPYLNGFQRLQGPF